MSTAMPGPQAPASLAAPSGDRRWRRGVRAVGVLAAAATVAATVPDLQSAAATGLLLTAAAMWLVELLATPRDARVEAALLVLVGLAGAALNAVAGDSAGFLFAYFAAAAIGLRLPMRLAASAVGLILVAMAAAILLRHGGHTASSLAADLLGVAFAGSVASAMRNARQAQGRSAALLTALEESRAAQAESAALAERARLAREIHDILAHSLSGQVMSLEAASLLAERTGADEHVRLQIDRAQRLARAGLEETRQAIQALRGQDPPDVRRLGELVGEASRTHGVPTTFTTSGTARKLSAEAQLTLYRAVQEAVTNTGKHARPGTSSSVTIDWQEHDVELTVTDHHAQRADSESTALVPPESDAGLSVRATAPLPESGYGLTGLRERAALAGGALDAGPTEDGFVVHLRLPYARGTAS